MSIVSPRLFYPYARSLFHFVLHECHVVVALATQAKLNQAPGRGTWGHSSCVRWVLFLSVACTWSTLVLRPGAGDVYWDYAIGCNATTTLFVAFSHLIASPTTIGCHVEGITWQIALVNAYTLRMSPRDGHKVTLCHQSRGMFLLHRSMLLLLQVTVLDVLNTIAFQIPYFHPKSHPPDRSGLYLVGRMTLWALLPAGNVWAGVNLMYHAYSLLSVITRSSKPEDWPLPLFGSVWEAYSVTRIWRFVDVILIQKPTGLMVLSSPSSKFWHQLMRNVSQLVLFRLLQTRRTYSCHG